MTRIRLMTANVLEDESDTEQLGALIDRVNPDLVFLQEMTEGPSKLLEERFEHHFLYPSEEYEGRGVASKLPAECGSVEIPWRPGTYARLELDGRTLVAGGFHMSNPIQFPWWRSFRERRDQLEALMAWADQVEADHLLLAGDFNSSPSWPLYRQLIERWDDLVADASEDPERTWSWRPGWPRLLRIDHVFGRGVRPIGATVEPVFGSDHQAVIVDLEV